MSSTISRRNKDPRVGPAERPAADQSPAGLTRRDAFPQLVFLVVCAGVILASLDLFIVNVAVPKIGRAFHLHAGGLADLSWVLNGYTIAYAAFLVLFGRLAERYRRERAFLLGVAIFVAASAACGAASSLPMLVAFSVAQGAGAALLTPTSLGLILATFSPERRNGAVRDGTAVGSLAAASGPVIGGLLVTASWRWTWGWGDSRTISALAVAVVALGLFAVDCARSRNPLIERELFRLRPLVGASAVAAAAVPVEVAR